MIRASFRVVICCPLAIAGLLVPTLAWCRVDDPAASDRVSYDRQIRPILQANCQGCHQPAKPGGGYVMTLAEKLRAGGESGMPAVVPGQPDESELLNQIDPDDTGAPLMPKGKPSLAESDRDLIRRWISQGAVDDTPDNAVARYDVEHPPIYTRPPVIAAIAFSPDGKLLAVGGFHEVLLWTADGSQLIARLIGLSERIESLAFSPDGTQLAVTGGLPGRMGEVQVWDVEKRKLSLSAPVTFDTVYGGSWSPDGKSIAFGCSDNTVRAIDSQTGEQTLFMGSHTDWPLDTVFSRDGANLISVSRDMSVKLTEVASQRFIDNITSITPGALKGGVSSVIRHPTRNEVLIGGADGIPKIYRIFRETPRQIGDDANRIAFLEEMPGRIRGMALSSDGHRLAVASGLDGKGQLDLYDYAFDETRVDEATAAILKKEPTSRTADERHQLDTLQKQSLKRLASIPLAEGAIYALSLSSDGAIAAVAGSDGRVHRFSAGSGEPLGQFLPVEVNADQALAAALSVPARPRVEEPVETDPLPAGAQITELKVEPASVAIEGKQGYAQVLVTARTADGKRIDATRLAERSLSAPVAAVSPSGLVTGLEAGSATVRFSLAGQSVELPVSVSSPARGAEPSFVRDVAPLLSRMGCNAGTCHGSAQGKAGFKLSLRGYDPIFDVRALTDELAARRVNVASPDDSLMLLKSSAAVPHGGGQLIQPGDPYYEIVRAWIAAGARLDLEGPRVVAIGLSPENPIIDAIGGRQQFRVVARYSDGVERDVTREAFIECGNAEVATASKLGLMTAIRRGEAPILARFEGAYSATTLTVMGDRTGYTQEPIESWTRIDELVADKLRRMQIAPSGLCTDAEFIRRVTLDLTGLPPTADEVRAFTSDSTPTREKRAALVERLIGNNDFVEYWTNKWADLLQVNRKFLGVEGAAAFRGWIRGHVEQNTPYDQFAQQILTATGSNKENPAASYFKILREPAATMENTTQLFLAIRFNCNKCHDHPFERWTQDQYYQTAAFFAQVQFDKDPASGAKTIGGTAVEGAKPLFEKVSDTNKAEVIHDRTHTPTAPVFPYEVAHATTDGQTRRQQFAGWLTSAENPYFARSYVNRLWGYLLGTGIIEPLDDIRAGNPPTNPELLDYLTAEFVKSGFDVRHIMRLICESRTYQLSVATNRWNADDRVNYSHALARRLPAEVLYDSVYRVTGSITRIPGVPPGTRAAELVDSEVELPSGFFTTFGRPARESACECERSSGLQLGPVMALVSGPTVADAIADPESTLTQLVARESDDRRLIEELFLRILNRPATESEIAACLEQVQTVDDDHRRLAEELAAGELQFALKRPALEREREAAINTARAALTAYEAEAGPRKQQAEKAQQERVAALTTELLDIEKKLAAQQADWESHQSPVSPWLALDPAALSTTNGSTLTKQPDRSIVVAGENKPGVVTLVADTDLGAITGIRLEALTQADLPNQGPGRAPDGNFVLTEIELLAGPKGKPDEARPIKLVKPLADFSQAGLEVAKAVDGNKDDAGSGWAVYPVNGVTHWATFETPEPIGGPDGTSLTIRLHHKFNGNVYQLGRFRVSVTRKPQIGLDLPDDFRTFIATAPEVRTEAQRAQMTHYFRLMDNAWRDKQKALAAAKGPLPEDPRLVELKKGLEQAGQPVPVDPRLAQLRADIDQSARQAASRRLTAAQDITWALLNTPAFLFNH